MEMDLDMGDEESDSNLVPPGTDTIALKQPTEDIDLQNKPCPQDAIEISRDERITKLPATPSQESIWSMLEQPIKLNADGRETETASGDQWQAVEKVQIVVSIGKNHPCVSDYGIR